MATRFGKYILVVLLLSTCYVSFAQGRRNMPLGRPIYRPNYRQPTVNQTPIQRVKMNYISIQLALPPQQTIKFQNLYRQYEQEMHAVRILKQLNNSDSQANGTEQVNKNMGYERELVDIHQHYTDEFLKVMPPEKVSLIFKSEDKFNAELLEQYKNKRRQQNGPSPVPTN
jgi:hypothetical protein